MKLVRVYMAGDEVTTTSEPGALLLIREIGKGGMSVVFEAVREPLGQRVAVKFPRESGRLQHLRLLHEAQVLASMQNNGVVAFLDHGRTDLGLPFIIFEYLEGETIRQRLTARPQGLPPTMALLWARQVAATMDAVHAMGVAHLDLKPENLFLTPDAESAGGERVKILDFGIARVMSSTQEIDLRAGTVSYMAPEQIRDPSQAAAPADVYALGVIIYELLSGQPPFVGTREHVQQQHLIEEAAPLRRVRPELSPHVTDLVRRMLDKIPERRPTMDAVAAMLRTVSSSSPAAQSTAPRLELVKRPRMRRAYWMAALFCSAVLLGALLPPFLPTTRRARMAYVPAGTFTIGSTDAEVDAAFEWARSQGCTVCVRGLYAREQPEHLVTLSPFELDVNEVTNEDLAEWLNQQPSLHIKEGRLAFIDDQLLVDLYPGYGYSGLQLRHGRVQARRGFERKPAAQVSFFAAQRYCGSLGKRLPTEAEWEWEARSGQSYRFPWGDDNPRCAGTVFGRTRGQPCEDYGLGPSDVGTASQDRSLNGVRDLSGNVAEWTADPYHDTYQACAPPCKDPIAPPRSDGAAVRVVRGGAWYRLADASRAAGRSKRTESEVSGDIGFRCARSVGKIRSGPRHPGTQD